MNDNRDDIHIDYSSLLTMMTDKIITDFVLALLPDDSSRKLMKAMIDTHRKYGIDASTSIKIIKDAAELMLEEDKHE